MFARACIYKKNVVSLRAFFEIYQIQKKYNYD